MTLMIIIIIYKNCQIRPDFLTARLPVSRCAGRVFVTHCIKANMKFKYLPATQTRNDTRSGSGVSRWRLTRWMERRTVTSVKPQSSQLRFRVQCHWNCDKLATRWTKLGNADPSRGSEESDQCSEIAHVDLLYKFQLKMYVFFHIQSALVGLH